MKLMKLGLFILVCFFALQGRAGTAPKPVIVLDPGHGGIERGVKVGGLDEATYTLTLAQKVAENLKKSGLDVRLTRENDVQLNAASRTALANNLHADALVSLHVNFSYNQQARGLRVFVPAPGPVDEPAAPLWEQAARQQAVTSKSLGQHIAAAMGGAGGKSVQSLKLALFRGLGVPAAEVEVDYASNPDSLTGLAAQETLASKLAGGIANFVHGVKDREASRASSQP